MIPALARGRRAVAAAAARLRLRAERHHHEALDPRRGRARLRDARRDGAWRRIREHMLVSRAWPRRTAVRSATAPAIMRVPRHRTSPASTPRRPKEPTSKTACRWTRWPRRPSARPLASPRSNMAWKAAAWWATATAAIAAPIRIPSPGAVRRLRCLPSSTPAPPSNACSATANCTTGPTRLKLARQDRSLLDSVLEDATSCDRG